jgi:subtilisin-like proprotein convertase family protein
MGQANFIFGILIMYRCASVLLCSVGLAVASLSFSVQAQVFSVPAEPDSLGLIPDGAGQGPGNYGEALDVRFEVEGTQGYVGRVAVEFSANHPFVGDLRVRLIAPDGTEHLLFEQTGVSTDNSEGFASNLVDSAVYAFSDAASVHWWTATDFPNEFDLPSTNARSNRSGDIDTAPGLPDVTSMDQAFLGTPMDGTWILRFDDGFVDFTGEVTAAFLSLEFDVPDIVVSNANDAGPGSLRQAMLDAGAGQTIAFDPGFFSTPRTIDLLTALPAVQQSLNIQGPGADVLTVQRSASAVTDFQPFFTTGFEGRFALSGMRIAGGRNLAGGGVFTQNSSFRGSELDIDGNEARVGGGLGIADAQQALLLNSLVRGNSGLSGDTEAADGSGVFVSCLLEWDCSFRMINTTVTGNAPGASDEIASIVLSMGGGFVFDATIENNTIVSDSTGLRLFERIATPGTALDVSFNSNIVDAPESIAFSGQGGSIVVGSFCCNLTTDDFFAGSEFDQSNTDPELQPLADNGGPTLTHAILSSSPAVDNGFAPGLAFDQRGPGFPRTFDTGQGTVSGSDGTDSGAFEFTPEDRIFGSRFELVSEIIRFDNVNFTPNEDGIGGAIRWIDGTTCDCDVATFDFNIYRFGGQLAFFWPGSTVKGGVSLDGGNTYALLLPGSVVGPDSEFIVGLTAAAAGAWSTPSGQDAFLGFRFEDNGRIKYGYARIETGPNGSPATIVSYAFENSGGPITVP